MSRTGRRKRKVERGGKVIKRKTEKKERRRNEGEGDITSEKTVGSLHGRKNEHFQFTICFPLAVIRNGVYKSDECLSFKSTNTAVPYLTQRYSKANQTITGKPGER